MAVPESPKRKEEWLAESHFHDLNVAQVLAEVERRVKDSDQPLVLLDLDSTLYEVGPRTYQILKEWISGAGSRVNAAVIQALTRLEPKQVGYSLRDTFRTVGLNLEKPEIQHAWEEAKKFWVRFSSAASISVMTSPTRARPISRASSTRWARRSST